MAPEVAGVDREFDYVVPDDLSDLISVGTSVRVPLHGRRVAGWVVADDVRPPEGVRLLGVDAVRGMGPAPEVVQVARWAAWRWAGRPASVLRRASPPRLVRGLPPPGKVPAEGSRPARARTGPEIAAGEVRAAGPDALATAFTHPAAVLRLGPAGDRWPAVLAAVERLRPGASVLILAPGAEDAGRLAGRLRRQGVAVALMPDEWAEAAAGGRVVVGARGGAWAPAPDLQAVLVLDGHEEAYKEERAPCWRATEVVAERARRAGAPCVITSPCPTVELLSGAAVVAYPRAAEWTTWPVVEVVDRRGDDPRSGLISSRLVDVLRSAPADPTRPAVCVLNRKGRARLLACRACGTLVRCHQCPGAMVMPRDGSGLRCLRCQATRPGLCLECGASRLSVIRPGVTRVAEEIAALAGRPTVEVSSDARFETPGADGGPETPLADGGHETPQSPILVGTEAVLHRVRRASTVAFLDFDQELSAPRFRAAEQAMALLARAGRMVGGRPARLLVQSRLPDDEVLAAASAADPGRLAETEDRTRAALRLPPYAALALISGPEAGALVADLEGGVVAVAGMSEDRWLVRADSHEALADALARAGRRPGARVEVDPLRV